MRNKSKTPTRENANALKAYAAALSTYFYVLSEVYRLSKQTMLTQTHEHKQPYFFTQQRPLDAWYEESLELYTILITHMRSLIKKQ